MSKSDHVTAEGHMAELQYKHTRTELCNRKRGDLRTKNVKNTPKIFNCSRRIINLLNVNKRMRQKTTLEKKTISEKFQHVQNSELVSRDREKLKMLILQRHPGESIWIGDNVQVIILSNANGITRIGITAPPEINIAREELRNREKGHATITEAY